MLQHLIVRTSDAKRLKPFIKSALEREVKLLDHSIQRTLHVLAHYESRYGMTSENLKSTKLRKPWNYLDWWMEIEALRHLEAQRACLKEVQLE